MKFLAHRISDLRMLRLVRKFLRAGASEDGEWSKSEAGTPQGSVISSILANIYMHYALDLWVNSWRRNPKCGEVHIVRYSDDFVMGVQHKSDAERFLVDLKERVAKFSLEVHEDKTKLTEFVQ
jgi:retron-type reverse transcriptase